MTSQRVERAWIHTGGYGWFRGEWVNKLQPLSEFLTTNQLTSNITPRLHFTHLNQPLEYATLLYYSLISNTCTHKKKLQTRLVHRCLNIRPPQHLVTYERANSLYRILHGKCTKYGIYTQDVDMPEILPYVSCLTYFGN